MFPENRINPNGLRSEFLAPDGEPRVDFAIDKEFGGLAINNVSLGLLYQIWTLNYSSVSGELRLTSADTLSDVLILVDLEIEEVSLTFDQNMQPAVAYFKGGSTYFRWFDTTVNTFVTQLYSGCKSPLLALDNKRREFTSISDMIIAYIRDQSIYFRVQRDRFLIEYKAADLPLGEARILNMGKSIGNRFQFYAQVIM